MSAPGIQLKPETHLPLVQPTVQQYLRGIKEAVIANNLPAAQKAFEQLQRATFSLGQTGSGQPSALATRVANGVQAIGQALEQGDLSGVEEALAQFRPSASSSQNNQPEAHVPEPSSPEGSDPSPQDGSASHSGTNVNARV